MPAPLSTRSANVDVGVRPGDVLAGKYRVERVIGVGGMGVVVAAHHIRLDEKVALKFLLPHALQNAEAVGRFLREAQAAAKIKSEHVARVSDVGELETGAPYIVMEYLDGTDLSGWIREKGAMPVEQATDFVLQACEALADAHTLGIVHRDLKPANLFLVHRSDGGASIKVLDFGISKVVSGALSGDMTRTTALVGSPYYMSPEQMQASKNVDARSDIWALGVILYELVTGRLPFDADAVTELAIKIAITPHPPVRSLRADIAPGFEQLVSRCLEKDRTHRFQDVGELALALRDYGSREARTSVERILGTLHRADPAGGAGAGYSNAPAAATSGPARIQTGAGLPPFGGLASSTGGTGLTPGHLTPMPGTGANWGQTGGSRRPANEVVAVVAVLGVLAVLGVGGIFLFKRGASAAPAATIVATPPPPAASTPAAVVAPPPASTAAPQPAPDAVLPPAAADTDVAPGVPEAAAPAPPKPVAVARPVTPTAPAVVTPPKPSKANCDPPYYFDSSGNRLFKKECL